MRRVLASLLIVAAAITLLVAGSGASDGDGYEVRAIFDTGGFVVEGEEVRIAGATVGTIAQVDVTDTEEAAHDDGSPEPGRAVVVMSIDDEAFQDFRVDASCVIRPQSLLGEKFVECEPTQPRAPGTEPAPALNVIEDGEPGEGQRLLPLERNRKAVDLDLLNNILEEPYPDRFRLVLNEFGAGLATRGEDLEELINRGNPALRETNEVLAILKGQTRDLERLATDGDQVLGPLARERDRLAGFINEANETATATAERRTELEAGFQRLPGFLQEVRTTMPELERFASEATPTIAALGDAAPEITRATVALEPFADAANTSLQSLGDATEDAGDDLAESDPILVDIRDLARGTEPAAADLSDLLSSTRRRNGFDYITRLIYNGVGVANGFDSRGHFLRALLPLNNCVGYVIVRQIACQGIFAGASGAARVAATERWQERALSRIFSPAEDQERSRVEPAAAAEESPEAEPPAEDEETEPRPTHQDRRALLDFLFESEEEVE